MDKDFKFWYAAVLQNPTDHNTNEQPSFVYYCTRGNKINPNSSDNLDINLNNAIINKIKKNAEKYPVHKAKGKHTKYNKL